MASTDIEPSELTKWDPGLTERVTGITRPFLKRYFRSEVRGLKNMPPGGALLVSNHSGGMLPMDVPILQAEYYHEHGYGRPLYTLSHDMLSVGPTGDFFKKIGYISANHENADAALRSGGLVVVFPGGDYDVYRPTLSENVIDFGGRTGYVKAALNAGVPIVPTVGIGGQETQIFLSRGTWLAKQLGPIARLARTKIVPISFGFPFGLSLVDPAQSSAARQDRDGGAAGDRHHRRVRRGPGHRRGRCSRAARHAAGAGQTGLAAPAARAGIAIVAFTDRLADTLGIVATMRRAGIIAPMRPDKYIRIAAAMQRENMGITSGFAAAAQRCPDRPGLVDELGTLTWREIDQRADAFAAALQEQAAPKVIGIMARNHRGFVEALIAANRIGADVLLLNTSFAGPALAEVVQREGVDAVIYDEEFTATVDRALADKPDATRIIAWTDGPQGGLTVEMMIGENAGRRPQRARTKSKVILLTSGTTGSPKGAKHSGGADGGPGILKAILDRTPWRAEEPVVVVAPMFHAWGFSQLVFAASLACTVVTRRKFDPEATLELIDRHRATGLCVVPVMFDRIMELPDEVRAKYSGRSLRFAAASGSRMRPDVVISFMDQFGDVIYNNYNATEAGMIATATPQDLRAAPDTAGKPAGGTEIRILDSDFNAVPQGEVGGIYVRNSTQFDGYTSGKTKDFHEGFMSSGDIGYLDDAGRLFVVGRDDEMIVSGGENVYPIEVEKTLTAHPDIAEASVIGVDDEQFGQRLAAFVVLNDGASATPDLLKQHVRENLANYKVPRDITILDELPRGSTGKIVRRELQDRAGRA